MAKKIWSKMLEEWRQLVSKAKKQLEKLKPNEGNQEQSPQM